MDIPDKSIDVYIEGNVGQNRCGVEAASGGLLGLARRLTNGATPGLHFKGLHCYHGSAQHVYNYNDRKQVVAAVAEKTRASKSLLTSNGIPVQCITGGGTGTFE